jgi:hypothetical protein
MGRDSAMSPAVAPADRRKDVVRDEWIEATHSQKRESERSRSRGATSASSCRKRRRHHPRRANRRSAGAREVGIHPHERHGGHRCDSADIHSRRERCNAHEQGVQQLHGPGHDENEVHSRHRKQMRQPARSKVGVVRVGEIRLAENERASHRRRLRGKRYVYPSSNVRARPVDPGAGTPPSRDDPNIDDAAGEGRGAPRLTRSRVTRLIVPKALGPSELSEESYAIAARERIGAAVESRNNARSIWTWTVAGVSAVAFDGVEGRHPA